MHDVQDLCQVRNQSDQYKALYDRDMDYDMHVQLLQSVATNYDMQFSVNSKFPAKPKQSIYSHELANTTEFSNTISDEWFDIDTPITMIQAYAATHTPIPKESQLPYRKWSALPLVTIRLGIKSPLQAKQ